MPKFIRLTEKLQRGDVKTLILNTDNIAHIQSGLNGADTHVRLLDGKNYYFVTESVDQIELMLLTDNTKAPIIMTADEALKYYDRKGYS